MPLAERGGEVSVLGLAWGWGGVGWREVVPRDISCQAHRLSAPLSARPAPFLARDGRHMPRRQGSLSIHALRGACWYPISHKTRHLTVISRG
jgi:hypothetical protein